MKNNINMRKKLLWGMIFAVMGIGMLPYHVYGAGDDTSSGEVEAFAQVAQADKNVQEALAIPAPTVADASAEATNEGLTITGQIRSFIGNIVGRFQSTFDSVKKTMGEAFRIMKEASDDAIKALQTQIASVKKTATAYAGWLGTLVNAIIKLVVIAGDVFIPKEDLAQLLQKGIKLDLNVPGSRYSNNIKYANEAIAVVKENPGKSWTEKEKLEIAKQFFAGAGHNIKKLLEALNVVFDALPDNVKKDPKKAPNWLDKPKDAMKLTGDYIGAVEKIMTAPESQ